MSISLLRPLLGKATVTALVLSLWGHAAQAQPEPQPSEEAVAVNVSSLREAREAAEARDQARLQHFLEDRQALAEALEQAREAHQQASEQSEALQAQQAEQVEQARQLAGRQSEQGSALTTLLSNLERHSSEVRNSLGSTSWLTVGSASLPPRLSGTEVLERQQVEAIVDSLAALTAQTGRVERRAVPVTEVSGRVEPRDVVILGDFAAFTETALLSKDEADETLAEMPSTPNEILAVLSAYYQGDSRVFAIDPTQGNVLRALAQKPTLWERFQQGGAVGYVIVVLGVLGLLVALVQYSYLLVVSSRVKSQRKTLDQLRDDNPLGRVLKRFDNMDKHQTPEALEARLDEVVLAEFPRLERGQPIVKLLAAIAPLLGLLGTVTGMIVTFQAITVFGTGDPQVMAVGISQALVTTVQGLVTAVPLLFAHTALSSRSRSLTQVIESEASATLADHLEAQSSVAAQAVN